LEFFADFVEHVDRASVGAEELSRLGDNGGQDGFEGDIAISPDGKRAGDALRGISRPGGDHTQTG
jgi:hypothetical protein